MANLKFKMGSYANLASAQKEAGTVYIVKDEQSMYVDISNSERIKIQGTVAAYSTLTDFNKNIKPPYSSNVIYFIAEKNALIRWDNTAQNWIQLNATADSVQDAIDILTKAINDNASDISELQKTATSHGTKIGTLEGEMDAVEGRATNLETRATNLETRATNIENAIGNDSSKTTIKGRIKILEDEMDTAQGDISELQGFSSTHTTDISDLKTRMKTAEDDIDAVEGRATNLETRATNVENAIGTDTTAGTVKYRIKTLETEMDEAQEGILDLERDSVAQAGRLESLETRATNVEKRATDVENAIGTDTTSGTVKYRIKTLEGEMDAVEGRATNLETRMDEAEGDIGDLSKNLSTFQTTVANTYVTKSTYNTKMTALDKSISDINTAIGADATTGTIKGRIKVLEGEMDAVEKRATDLETDVSELQAAATDHGTRIGTLEGEMDAVEGRMDIAEGDIDKVENRATNLETRATNIENAIGTDTAEGTIKGRITAAEGDISGLSTNVTNIWSSLGKSDTESGTVRYRVKAVENAIGTDTTAGTVKYRIKTLETDMDAVEKRADNVEKAIGADDVAGSVKGRITELEGDVSSLTDNITKNYATKTELSNVNTTLTKKINDEIKAVNAMSYKNGVSAWSQLPTSNATNKVPKVGDTYVVTEAFERTVNNVTTYYQPGDLLVASGTETGTGKDAYITSNLAWNHVKTGYDIELDPNLTVANNIIYLKNYNNEDLGNIKIQSSTNNLKVSTSGNTISFNLEWDTFDPAT